jgi:hypothetical protein
MGLPFVLDVAIGSVFIFLTLSLLASELQELITTVLQWRAKHLRDAIEIFLAGGVDSRSSEVHHLVTKLYDDPLLKNINQEAKGVIAKFARQVSRLLPGNHAGAFGRNRSTGPSYIAPETFATSLLERLGLATLSRKLTEVRLEKFQDRILSQIQTYAESANIQDLGIEATDNGRNFKILVDEYAEILDNFRQEEATLTTCVEQMAESLSAYITSYPVSEDPPSLDLETGAMISPSQELSYFAKRLRSLKLSLFGEKNERAMRSGGLRPSLTEIADLANRSSNTYKEVDEAYRTIKIQGAEIELRVNPGLEKQLREEHPDTIEKQLINRDIKAAWDSFEIHRDGKTIERQLKKDYPELFRRVKPRLDRNSQKLYQAQRSPAYRRKRTGMKAMQNGLKILWQNLTGSDLSGLERQRQGLISRVFDQLSDEEQKQFVTRILDGLPEVDRAEVMDNALADLDNESRYLVVNQVLDQLILTLDNSGMPLLTEAERSIYDRYQTYKSIQQVLSSLPNSVQESFAILARRAQTRVQQTGNDVSQFRDEVGLWFDRAMSRSSGVYKRNAKGVALLIGLVLAVSTNADTFYIIERLSSDENLRQVVTQQAIQIKPLTSTTPAPGSSSSPNSISDRQQLKNIKSITDSALQEMSLPLGWNPTNVTQQLGCRAPEVDRDPAAWETLLSSCLPEGKAASNNLLANADQISKTHWAAIPKILLGWLVSGIAISMGAPFWFDLLGKIINVRNSGGKPPSPAAEQVKINNPE